MTKKTSFELVSMMNEAFGNPKGDPNNIDWGRVRAQFKNIGHEFVELMNALGGNTTVTSLITSLVDQIDFPHEPHLEEVRDGSRDIVVFADGGHHLMGIDGDRDMQAVIDGVMTRFVKDPADMKATMELHASKGVTHTYVEGEYPTAILKSKIDQPDAPKGKFLKSASYQPTVFYKIGE